MIVIRENSEKNKTLKPILMNEKVKIILKFIAIDDLFNKLSKKK
jgi:hypothetical protein